MEAATAIEARPTLATLASWTGRATLATGRGADLATGLATGLAAIFADLPGLLVLPALPDLPDLMDLLVAMRISTLLFKGDFRSKSGL